MENIGSNRVASEKTAEAEITETPPPIRVQNAKPLSFSSNGVLKRHNPLHHHHHRSFNGSHRAAGVVVTYKECLKNHAASLGGHAVDGCGEFMPPPPAAAATNPTLLKCAACGCHRNFHRREPEETMLPKSAVEYQSHHRHRPPPPPPPPQNHGSPNNSPSSPPPISSAYYPSAPHMLLALSTGFSGPPTDNNNNNTPIIPTNPNSRKRFRTKFTQDQKDKMLGFAEKVGWKIQKRDEDLINEFCTQIGVERGVLKVWMHNNKSTLCKKDQSNAVIDNVNGTDFQIAPPAQFNLHQESSNNSDNVNVAVNGSSSSS